MADWHPAEGTVPAKFVQRAQVAIAATLSEEGVSRTVVLILHVPTKSGEERTYVFNVGTDFAHQMAHDLHEAYEGCGS